MQAGANNQICPGEGGKNLGALFLPFPPELGSKSAQLYQFYLRIKILIKNAQAGQMLRGGAMPPLRSSGRYFALVALPPVVRP